MTKAVLPEPTNDAEQAKSDLSEAGIAFHADFLAPAQRAALLERVLEQATLEREQGVAETSTTGTASELRIGAGSPDDRFQAVSFLPNKGRVFLDLMQDPRILSYCRHVFHDVPFYLATQTATIVRKGAAGQVIHTDQQAWPFLTPVPVMFNVAVALTDFTPAMGSTRFVPGTKDGEPPRIGFDEASGRVTNLDPLETSAADLRAGGLAMWDARLWHGQGSSVSDQERVVIIQTYVMHMVRAQDNFACSLHDDVYAELTDAEKRLLGLEVCFEYAGRIAPRTAVDTRRNTNFCYPFVPELRRGTATRAVPRAGMNIGHAETMAEII